MANRCGDRTEPCLTPKLILKKQDRTAFHFTQVQQLFNHCSKVSRSSTGICRLINLIYNACRFSLSNAFDKSIAHKFTVLPPLTKRSIILRTEKLHDCNLALSKNRIDCPHNKKKESKRSKTQCSKIFEITGLIANTSKIVRCHSYRPIIGVTLGYMGSGPPTFWRGGTDPLLFDVTKSKFSLKIAL
jgi:hypothetical protein